MTWGRYKLVLPFAVFFLTTCTSAPPSTSPDPVVGPSVISLSVHYVTDQKDIRKKFEQTLAKSNETLMPHGIGLVVWSEDRVFRLPENIVSKQDRQLLGGRVHKDGTLHVFVVDTVSVEPGDGLNGLHTRTSPTHRDFVILSKTARLTTLAHEVGHALGLDHEDEKTNVMCTKREDKGAGFTTEQGDLMRVAAREFVARDW